MVLHGGLFRWLGWDRNGVKPFSNSFMQRCRPTTRIKSCSKTSFAGGVKLAESKSLSKCELHSYVFFFFFFKWQNMSLIFSPDILRFDGMLRCDF